MKLHAIFALMLAFSLSLPACGDQLLHYGPKIQQISGSIYTGKSQHPNGTWFPIVIMKLDILASIKGIHDDEYNVSESNVKEVQLSPADKTVFKRIRALDGKHAVVMGTIWHEQTAWHVRRLVMVVQSVKK